MTKNTKAQTKSTSTDREVKFAVCAIIDLQGFSSHLEMSGYDLRTAIGKHAIERLNQLQDAMERVSAEKTRRTEFYPNSLYIQRINDAIVVTMDLDDILMPSIGQTGFHGLSANDVDDFFSAEEMEDKVRFTTALETRLKTAVVPLEQFLGVVSRIHLFIQDREARGYFPGAKTIVSSGFRKPFVTSDDSEDFLSANFAFANATLADKVLRGPHLFVDNNILEILSRDRFAQHLMQFSQFDWRISSFDPLTSEGEEQTRPPKPELHAPHTVELLRRRYVFRQLSASPLSYLQHLKNIEPFLNGVRNADRSNLFYAHVCDAIRYGIGGKRIHDGDPPPSFINSGGNDLDVDVIEFVEFLTNGESPTKAARQKQRRRAQQGPKDVQPDSELAKKLDALDEQEVTIDLESIDVAQLGHAIWSLTEETISGLLPIMSGDMSLLDYPIDRGD